MTATTALTDARLPAKAIFSLHQSVARERPPVGTATFLRQIGYGLGEGLSAAFADWVSREESEEGGRSALLSERYWELFSRFWEEQLGWGALRHSHLHPGVAALDSEEWAEAGTAGATGCHLTTGILAELLRSIADADAAVLEVECRCRGDQRCRFLFGSPAALERLYGDLRSGSSYGDALQQLG